MDNDKVVGVHTRNAFLLLDDDAPAPSKPKSQPKVEAVKPAAKKQESARPQSGRGRGRGNNRGRGGRGRGDVRKREFDRHESGTGRDRRAKREGAGKYNWGVEGEEEDRPRRRNDRRPKTDTEAKPDTEGDAEKTGEEEIEKAEKPAPKVEEEEEDKSVSYEEYLAQKESAEEDLCLNIREVDIDDSQFKATTEAVKDVEDDDCGYAIGEGKKAPKKKGGKKNKTGKVSLDEFTKAPKSSSNYRSRDGGRGGRGRDGGRGSGRGARAPRDARDFNLAATVDQFPTLGSK